MKEQRVNGGWLTAEYSMLPYSTFTAEAARHLERPARRPQQRNSTPDRPLDCARWSISEKLGPRTMWVDCDVLQADGGTRTAAITGASLAVSVACRKLVEEKNRRIADQETCRGGQCRRA